MKKLASTVLFFFLCGCGSDVVNQEPENQDPVAEEIPIAFVARDTSEAITFDVSDPTQFNPGASIIIKTLAGVNAPLLDITSEQFDGPIDIKHLSASYDGSKLVFSLRAPEIEDASEDEQPKWDIWLYDIEQQILTPIIQDPLIANEGDDLFPSFLPDGRIIFSSNRQQTNKAILLDEGKPQYQAMSDDLSEKAITLHVIEQDGSQLEQISFSQGHDLYPTVMQNGKIAFVRFEHRGRNRGLNIYQIDSDGKQLELLFGAHSDYPDELAIASMQQAPNGQLVLGLRNSETEFLSTDYHYLDTPNFMDEGRYHDGVETQSSAFNSSLFAPSPMAGTLSLTGKYYWFTPIFDNTQRNLVVWSQCRVIDPEDEQKIIPCTEELLANEEIQAAPDLFGLWIYDELTQTQKPVVLAKENTLLEQVVVLEPKAAPLETETPSDPALLAEQVGALHIRSVYDYSGVDNAPPNIETVSDPSFDTTRIHAIRIIKPVSIPNRDDYRFSGALYGRSRGQSMRDIIGYAPVAPDGSVYVKVPANIPFGIELLNEQGQRVSGRHESWLQVRAGEKRTCNGCHQNNNELPHGKVEQAGSLNLGAMTTSWPGSFGDIDAQIGETMAESYARIIGIPTLSIEPIFANVWREGVTAVANNQASMNNLTTPKPLTEACLDSWNTLCRTTIHFESHIAPILALSRPVFDIDGETELANNGCINCHTPVDANGDAQIPAAQLDLSLTPSNDNTQHLTAYRELFFNDNEQEVVDGILIDRLVDRLDGNGDPVYLLDDEGEPLLDENGEPIIEQVTVRVSPALRVSGARSNTVFNTLFSELGSHTGYLTEAERSLIWQWLDIGAQYANSPFYEGDE